MSDTKNTTQGPAFPVTAGQQVYSTGATLRDYFAAHAPEMPDWWPARFEASGTGDDALAAWRFNHADAMVRERAK